MIGVMEKEIRLTSSPVECRDSNGKKIFRGYAAVFNSLSEDLGGFREIIRRGAFRDAIASGGDVRALVDHDDDKLLGRNTSGTLRLWEDETGLGYEVDDPETTYSTDLRKLMERNDVNKSSFAFALAADGSSELWRKEGDNMIREIHKVDMLFDVSPVTGYPAYPATSSALRSLEKFKSEQQPVKEPVIETVEDEVCLMLLDLKKKYLDLIKML